MSVTGSASPEVVPCWWQQGGPLSLASDTEMNDTEEVQAEFIQPILIGGVQERLRMDVASAIDERVDLRVRLKKLIDNRFNRGAVRSVASQMMKRASSSAASAANSGEDFRAWRMTRAPCAATTRAVAPPMPREDPVMSTTCPCRPVAWGTLFAISGMGREYR